MAGEVVAVDCINHNAVPDLKIGIEGVKEFVSHVKNAFPDIEFNIEGKMPRGTRSLHDIHLVAHIKVSILANPPLVRR